MPDFFPATVGTHFAGLPITEGQWVADVSRDGTILGWLEMFPTGDGQRMFSIPGASRYISAE